MCKASWAERSLSWIAEVVIDEDQVKRLQTGAPVKAYPKGFAYERLEGQIEQIDAVPMEQLLAEMLSDRFGCPQTSRRPRSNRREHRLQSLKRLNECCRFELAESFRQATAIQRRELVEEHEALLALEGHRYPECCRL